MTTNREAPGTIPASAEPQPPRPAYEAPRVLRKRAVDVVTLQQVSGTITSRKKGSGTFGGE
jgi:hypothetical protein